MNKLTRILCVYFLLFCSWGTVCIVSGEEVAGNKNSDETKLAKAPDEIDIEQLNLPQDTSVHFKVKELKISGNTLITTDELLNNMPFVYNTSDKPATQAEPGDLYNFRVLHDIIRHPGRTYEVSRRTMQGLTQYILSVYQQQGYGGIYVYIAADAVQEGAVLQNELLPIEVVEAKVSEIIINAYDTEHKKKEKGILRSSVIQQWSPIKVGQMVNKKKLDNYVSSLNRNPDRYVSAVISRGSEPNSLALGYDLYEANPWHFYTQIDDAGPKERQWAPKIGFINTNITGRDDRIAGVYQRSLRSTEQDYLGFASYEFPLFCPQIRLGVYGGQSDFDIAGDGGIDFLGKGSFYGSVLRLNAFQADSWSFNIASSLSHEHSKSTPSLFPEMQTDTKIDLWSLGGNLQHSGDMSNSSISLEQVQSIGGSAQREFWDPVTETGARTNSNRHFTIYNVSAAHSQFLDPNKIQRFSCTARWITANKRVPPSKMTIFGGLYSVRGYKEDEIVADGGTIISGQYEFDLVKYWESQEHQETSSEDSTDKPLLKRLALLGFSDFARAKTKSPVAGEKGTQEMCSVGLGTAITLGDNFDGSIYYGWPLRQTVDTDRGKGRWSFSFILRW